MTPGSPEPGPDHRRAAEGSDVAPILVLALGNVLLGDDGCGQHILAELRRWAPGWGAAVELVDGGTQGLTLLGVVAARRAVVLLDAFRLGAAPGTVHRLRGQELSAAVAGRGLTAHEGNAGELLRAAALLGELPAETVVVGIEPARLETGVDLSPEVRGAVAEGAGSAARSVEEFLAAARGSP